MAKDSDDQGAGSDRGAREAILERRKFFVASALAGLALSGCEKKPAPHPCLSEPMVCLSPVLVETPDAGSEDAGAEDADTDDAGSDAKVDGGEAKPPPPRVCLEMAPPPDVK